MLDIPMHNNLVTRETRELYLKELKRAGADRFFLFIYDFFGKDPEFEQELKQLKENIEFFEAAGLEVGVWIDGFGHGGGLEEPRKTVGRDFVRIRGLSNGAEAEDSICPMCEAYAKMFANNVKRVAETGCGLIMIDDDMRLCIHGGAAVGCACENHMKAFNRLALKEGLLPDNMPVSREVLAEKILYGEANELRKLWFKVQGDSLRDFCKLLREALDTVNPDCRLGQCACLDTWDSDGIDAFEIARLLAGKTKPFMRTIGAPYWNNEHGFNTTGLGSIIDSERLQFAWHDEFAPDVEIFTEGDLYPRPRYNTPYIYAEDFHQALLAEDNKKGILKYMLDYYNPSDYEKGYIDRHVYYKGLREEISAAFDNKKSAGVYVFEAMRKLEDMDLTGIDEWRTVFNMVSDGFNFANMTSLPASARITEYTKACLCFGENAKYLPERALKLPLILDSLAAEILAEKGIDTGFERAEQSEFPAWESFEGFPVPVPVTRGGWFTCFTLKPGARVLSRYNNGFPGSYLYENGSGQRFLVYGFDGERTDMTGENIRAYPRQITLFDAIEWLTDEKMPVRIEKQPSLYTIIKENEKETAVGIWNFYNDVAMPEKIPLGREYKSVRFIGGSCGAFSGNVIIPEKVIYPYEFFGFVLEK